MSNTDSPPRNQEMGPDFLTQAKGSNSLVSHQVLPLHTMQGGRYYSQQMFFTKVVDKDDGKMIIAHYPPL